MAEYLVGLGHGLATAALAPIDPQPRCPDGVIAAVRDFGADGTVFETGFHAVLLWSTINGVEDYQALLAQLGVNGTFLRRAVTITLPNFERVEHRYNGYILRPLSPNYAFFPSGIRAVVNQLVQIGDV